MKMRFFLTSHALLFLAQAVLAQAEDSTSQHVQRIENNIQFRVGIDGRPTKKSSIKQRLKQYSIPGISIAFVNKGKIEWAKGYGFADITKARKVDSKTLFLAGSISKPVSAIRALQLAESGRVNLDTDVNSYLRSWKVADNKFTSKEKVTLRRILNHTAGLTVDGFRGYVIGDKIPTTVQVLDGKPSAPWVNSPAVTVFQEPGKAFQYSGGGYTIMQLLVSDLEKMSFPDNLDKHVLHPLGMHQSTFKNPLPQRYHKLAATGYRPDKTEVKGKWPIYPEYAAAGLWTTPSDLCRYVINIQGTRQTNNKGVLSAKSVKSMLTKEKNTNWGLGPVITEFGFRHGGADEGFQAELVAWQDKAVVIMTNSDLGHRLMNEVLIAVAAEYDLPGFKRIQKSIAKLSKVGLEKWAGTYEENVGSKRKVEINVKGEGLELKIGKVKVQFFPEKEDLFFNRDGAQIRFKTSEGTHVEYEVLNTPIKATKISPPIPNVDSQLSSTRARL